jgi:hypothetical protein
MYQKVEAAVSIAGPAFRMQEDLDFMIRKVKKPLPLSRACWAGSPKCLNACLPPGRRAFF